VAVLIFSTSYLILPKILYVLEGGLRLVLEVQADKAVENGAGRIAEEIKETLRAKKIAYTKVARIGKWDIEVILPSSEQLNEFNDSIKGDFPWLKPATSETAPDGTRVLLTLDQEKINDLRDKAVTQALESTGNRIGQLGCRWYDIRREGGDRMLVQVPGIRSLEATANFINIIATTCTLEFKVVAQNVTDQEIRDNKLPPGVRLYTVRPSDRNTQETKIPLEDEALLSGQYITDARVQIGSSGHATITLNFDPLGARIFERLTSKNVGRKLAILLNGVVYSDPVIKERIPNGRAVIEGSYTDEEAKVLAIVFIAGSAPAPPVKVLDHRTVAPALSP